jgi:hypothetical protein
MTEYVVWRPDYGQTKEDGRHIDALSPRSACEKWAERDDAESADYWIVRGNEVTVKVARPDDGAEEVAYIINGESVPLYRARLVEQNKG